jgi:hypothetical protein
LKIIVSYIVYILPGCFICTGSILVGSIIGEIEPFICSFIVITARGRTIHGMDSQGIVMRLFQSIKFADFFERESTPEI